MIFSGAGSLSIYRRAVCSRLNCRGRGFEGLEARLEESPEVADIEEIGREAIGYFMGGGAVARGQVSSLREATTSTPSARPPFGQSKRRVLNLLQRRLTWA
jgi:hypothetical protein